MSSRPRGLLAIHPRVRVFVLLGTALVAALLHQPWLITGVAISLFGAGIWSGVTVRRLLQRLIWAIPFAGVLVLLMPLFTPGEPLWRLATPVATFVLTREGAEKAIIVGLRVLTCLLAAVVLTETTASRDIIISLAYFRVPPILIRTIELTFRYFHVLRSELGRLRLAAGARGFSPGHGLWDRRTYRTLGGILSALAVRSLERSERVYLAMLARGYGSERGH